MQQLLEREPFLDTLAEYANEARQGDGRLVLVSGESGIGKTALAEAFQRRLKAARWLWGACDGLLTPRPLGPVFDMAAQAGGELARLCAQGASRDQLFAAFQAELDGHATLTVAVIEDAHWADEARPGDLPAAVHLRAHRAAPRLRGAGQDRRLVPPRRRPPGRPAGHRDPGLDAAHERPAPDSRADRSGWLPGTGLIGCAVPPPERCAGRVHRCRRR
jgi:AAA ATPase domain